MGHRKHVKGQEQCILKPDLLKLSSLKKKVRLKEQQKLIEEIEETVNNKYG